MQRPEGGVKTDGLWTRAIPSLLMRLDVATNRTVAFVPTSIEIASGSAWTDLSVERWRDGADSFELAESVLGEHVIAMNLTPRADREIAWGGDVKQRFVFGRGALTVLPAGVPYTVAARSSGNDLILSLGSRFFEDCFLETSKPSRTLDPGAGLHDPFIQQAMLALQREVESGYLRGPAYAEAVGTAIAAHLVIPDTSLFARAFRLSNSDLQKIENYVAENIGGPILLNDMARLMDMSVFTFSRAFKRSASMTPHQFVLMRRIEKAKDLLLMSKQSLVEIALACGFSSQSHLGKVFYNVCRTSPNAYRKLSVKQTFVTPPA